MAQRALLHYIDTGDIDLRQLSLSRGSTLNSHSSASTHKGYIRLTNEDAFLNLNPSRLWLVADGMGGHKRGDFASKAVVKALQGFTPKMTLLLTIEDLQERLSEANQACQKAFRGNRVGTTVALLLEYGGYCFFLWAGDSRIYRLREQQLELMTRDHSLAQEKCDKGELNEAEAAAHPSAHILTRSLGVNRHLRLELRCAPVQTGDRYLLCSDGLYNDVTHDNISEALQDRNAETVVSQLMEQALQNGGRDNITLTIVDFSDSDPDKEKL